MDTQKQPKQKEKKQKFKQQHGHLKLNLLHQVALQISSTSTNDGYAKISRTIGKHFRGVLDTEFSKIDPAIKRIFCRGCRQVLSAGCKRFELKSIQKKVIQRKCINCGHLQNYQINIGYKSRNETINENKIISQFK